MYLLAICLCAITQTDFGPHFPVNHEEENIVPLYATHQIDCGADKRNTNYRRTLAIGVQNRATVASWQVRDFTIFLGVTQKRCSIASPPPLGTTGCRISLISKHNVTNNIKNKRRAENLYFLSEKNPHRPYRKEYL